LANPARGSHSDTRSQYQLIAIIQTPHRFQTNRQLWPYDGLDRTLTQFVLAASSDRTDLLEISISKLRNGFAVDGRNLYPHLDPNGTTASRECDPYQCGTESHIPIRGLSGLEPPMQGQLNNHNWRCGPQKSPLLRKLYFFLVCRGHRRELSWRL